MQVVRAAAALLLLALGLGCTGPRIGTGALADLEPYLWPRDGVLNFLSCRWSVATPIGVAVSGATPDEAAALERALRAWGQAGLGVRFSRAPWEEASVRVAFVDDPVPRADGSLGQGRSIADCLLAPQDLPRSGLVLVRVTLARHKPPDLLSRTRELSESERMGALLHELGHALGFQGHVRGDDPLSREPERVRRWGERVLAGEPLASGALAALYATAEPVGVLAQRPLAAARTHFVDRLARLAASEPTHGPFLRVGDGAARVFWRDARGREYGVQIHQPTRLARRPEALVLLPERATRDALLRSLDPRE